MAYTGLVLAHPHNWVDDIIERLQWATDVITTADGVEQRRQIREYPRRQLEYSYFPVNSLLRARLEMTLSKAQGLGTVMLPIWSDAERLSVTATAGSNTITVNTATRDYDVGAYLMLWRSPSQYEVVQIQTVNPGSVVLTQNLLSTWVFNNSVVAPARPARISRETDATFKGNENHPMKVLFDIDERYFSVNRASGYSANLYFDLDVFARGTDTGEDLPMSIDMPAEILDAGTGLVAVDVLAEESTDLIPWADKFGSRLKIAEFLGFLNTRKGRAIPFWKPTYEKDFLPVSMTGGISGTLVYQSNGFATLKGTVPGWKDIALFCIKQNVPFFGFLSLSPKRISNAVDNLDGTESITFNQELLGSGSEVNFRFCWLKFCRLESDAIELAWKNTCAATVKTSFRTMFNVPE